MARLRDELERSELECNQLVGVRESQESILSNRDDEIAELSVSMHSGLTEGEGSEMHQRANDVRTAREIVEQQRLRMHALQDSEQKAIDRAAELEEEVSALTAKIEELRALLNETTENARAKEVSLTESLDSASSASRQYQDALKIERDRADGAEARAATATVEAKNANARERDSTVAATEAAAQVATLERELRELADLKTRSEAEASAKVQSVTEALTVAESRLAALEHQRRESTPAIAAKEVELERLRVELNVAVEAKQRLEIVETNLRSALVEAKEAATSAEGARDASVAKARSDSDAYQSKIYELQERAAESSAEIEMLHALLDNQVVMF